MDVTLTGRKRQAAFTLYELVVVLSLSSIILALGVPSFRGTIANQRIAAATNDLVMALNLAKSEAIKRAAYVTVCKSSNGATCTAAADWNQGWIVFANDGVVAPGTFDAGDELIRVYPAVHETLTFTPSGTIDGFISFRPPGTTGTNAANLQGTITICDERGDEYVRGIVIQASGSWSLSHDTAHDGSALACDAG